MNGNEAGADRGVGGPGLARRTVLKAALAGGAVRLFSEDLQHGQTIDDMQIRNPFVA